jgi:hypothetical protein
MDDIEKAARFVPPTLAKGNPVIIIALRRKPVVKT